MGWRPTLIFIGVCAILVSPLHAQGACPAPTYGLTSRPAGGSSTMTTTIATPVNLKVALFQWVPRLDQFKQVLSNAWKQVEPNVSLEYVDWDGYTEDPPADLDVFVFDSLYLSYFQQQGFLAPLMDSDVEQADDILPYAWNDIRVNGTLHGIPQLGCTHVLFYRRNDTRMAVAKTYEEIIDALGTCNYCWTKPVPGKGLMMDMSGKTTNAISYLEAVQDTTGMYNPDPELPYDNFDARAIHSLQRLIYSASVNQTNASLAPYERARWFSEGIGRASVEYTEALSAMGSGRNNVTFKLMPLSNGTKVPLFFIDVVGINSNTVTRGLKPLALKLANLMTSAETIVQTLSGTSTDKSLQYLMPVRQSVFDHFSFDILYREMWQLIATARPRVLRVGTGSRNWLNTVKGKMKERILDCDYCDACPNQCPCADGRPP